MNVGAVIVSDLNHNNYGSALQAYATIKMVQRMGGNITLIKYKKQRSLVDWLKIAPGLMMSGGFELLKKRIKSMILSKTRPGYYNLLRKRFDATNEFKEMEFVPLFKVYRGYKALCDGSREYDVVFVGSDQVWRPYGYYSNYWNLNFVDASIPKFSYSSSYGVSKIPAIQRKGTRQYLERIDLISVRERKAKDIVEAHSNKRATIVADPTMLLSYEQWLDFSRKSSVQIPSVPYVFCYFLGPRKDIRDYATAFAKEKGLKIVCMPHMEEYREADLNFGDIQSWDANAYDFVNYISHAAYVCTDSFHGTVFSIMLHKKFFTFYREHGQSTNSRIDNLLGIFHLQDRLTLGQINDKVNAMVDYAQVDSILDEYRKDSIAFLKKALALSHK